MGHSLHFAFYRQALDDLKDNNKMQINLMTILADDYNSFSKEIVAVIAQQIMKVNIPVWFQNCRHLAILIYITRSAFKLQFHLRIMAKD